jgi:hypothetical protein
VKILVVSDEAIFPTNSGGRLAVLNDILALQSAGAETDLLIFHRADMTATEVRQHRELAQITSFVKRPSVLVTNARSPFRSYQEASRWGRHIRNRLAALPTYVVTIAHHEWTLPAAAALTSRNGTCVLRSHNDERRFLAALAQADTGLHRLYRRLEIARLPPARIRKLASLAHEVWVLSRADASSYQGLEIVHFPPVFASASALAAPAPTRPPAHQTMLFLGALDMSHAVRGLEWFIDQVLWRILASCPEARLIVAGRRAPRTVRLRLESEVAVTFLGEVEDASAVVGTHRVFLNPVHTGSGVNMKLGLPALHGIPVASTAYGARGLEGLFSKTLPPTDEPDTLARLAIKLLTDDGFWQRESLAVSTAVAQFSPTIIGRAMLNRLDHIRSQSIPTAL